MPQILKHDLSIFIYAILSTLFFTFAFTEDHVFSLFSGSSVISSCILIVLFLAGYILPGIIHGKWKRVLFVPTGALLSKVSFNEGDPIPGIAHAVVIEQYRVPDMM